MKRILPRLGAAASAVALVALCGTPLHAQESTASRPRWWFGGYLGGNVNMFSGRVDDLSHNHPRLVPPGGYDDGSGFGMTLGAIAEYLPGGLFGGSVMLGYDNRAIRFASDGSDALVSDTAWSHEVWTSLSYLSIEPNLRINILDDRLHAFGGPSIGINLGKGFTYESTLRTADTTVDGDLDDVRSLHVGGQIGVGYDIPVNLFESRSPIVATPFVQLRFGQAHLAPPDGSTASFGITTVRMGAALKFGSVASAGRDIIGPEEGDFGFDLRVPRHVTASRRVNETFPFRNYIFFEEGSSEIPARYRRIDRSSATAFREEQLTDQSSLTGGSPALERRERKQMLVYYEALNIIGDRMRRNQSAQIRLVGAANGNAAQGLEMAENVKRYLVNTFAIDADRITTDGQPMPPNRSGTGGARGEDQTLVAEENVRVVVDGPAEIVKPVRIMSTQEEPLGNDIVVTLPNDTMFASWSVELVDDAGAVHTFGPFTGAIGRVAAKPLLDGSVEAGYTARILATTREGRTMRSGTRDVRLERATGTDEQTADRYSILFEFDESKTVQTYEKFLAETVAPAIPHGAVVVVHGHTDMIGDDDYNAKLSQKRAEETQRILARELDRAGKHVTFDAYGFGEDERRAPYSNERPEHRYYNRTVVIEVVEGE
jgi:outer membrane protein OmpA-like peptidoglycan-associated protein